MHEAVILRGCLASILSVLFLSCSVEQGAQPFAVADQSQAVVYGTDSRQDLELIRGKSFDNASKVAALIDSKFVRPDSDPMFFNLAGLSLIRAKAVCPTERFAQQMVVARCSAVLVTSNRMLTAGHCIQNQEQCERTNVVFNFFHYEDSSRDSVVQANQVYKCKKLLGRKQGRADNDDSQDYALFELDRVNEATSPVNMQVTNDLQPGLSVYTLGHSMGLPMKFADGRVLSNKASDNMFRADLDAFSGNSGSPVFNSSSHTMIGLFVGGEDDLIVDPDRKCRVVKQCHSGECKGELVLKLSRIRKIFEQEFN